MEVSEIKRSIADQKEEVREKFRSEKIIQRTPSIDSYLRHPGAVAILGVRRCGKSFFSIMSAMKTGSSYGYVNFDDPVLAELKSTELKKVMEAIYQLNGDVDLVILDEIQNIKKWETFVARLRETKKVIITGSNSEMLSGELSTRMTGRHMDFMLFPFSFREYLSYKGLSGIGYTTKDAARAKALLDSYIREGGFPEVQKYGPKIVKQIYDDIISKDIIRRYNIRFGSAFRELMMMLISNFSSETSYNKMKNILGLKSVHTVKKYVEYAQNAYLFLKVSKYSPKMKEQLISPKKIYLTDHALAGMTFRVSENNGRLYENITAVELFRRKAYNETEAGIFYWKDYLGHEVDFVLTEGHKVKQLMQVCYDTDDMATKERETRSLLKASRQLKCNNLLVITGGYEGEENLKGKTIKFVPLWRWLLSGSHLQ